MKIKSVHEPPVRLLAEPKDIKGSGKQTRILILENQEDFVKLFRRSLDGEGREIHFAVDEEDAVVWQSLERFDIFIWVGWNVPTGTSRERKPTKEESINSVRKSLSGDEIINRQPYIIAVVHERGYFTPEEYTELGIREQVLGPADYKKPGRFRRELVAAVKKAEREIAKQRNL